MNSGGVNPSAPAAYHSAISKMAHFDPNALVPPPQQIKVNEGSEIVFPRNVSLVSKNHFPRIQSYLSSSLKDKGIKLFSGYESSKLDIQIEINPAIADKSQSYHLDISDRKIQIIAHDEAAVFYAINTFLQIIELSPSTHDGYILPQMEIHDWPDFDNRGLLLDISRDRVPTLETLKSLIDKLAKWKINQLQLYMEHTFAYKGHEEVWKNASAMTKEDILQLDAYCKSRFIELVPCQNSLAHMHRWVMHKNYRELAESPSRIHKSEIENECYEHEGNPGYSLCPTNPATIKFIKGLLDQLLPNFSSHVVNVGLDEPNDLATGGERSNAVIKKEGMAKIYLNYLNEVSKIAKQTDNQRLVQFWADVILLDKEAISKLPQDVIPLVWGYEDGFPFELGRNFKERNIKWYVCPSTCTWSSLGGRTSDSVHNLTQAAVKGKENQASGYLITEWGDNGHHNPLSVGYLGILLGSALSWKVMPQTTVDQLDIPKLLNIHVFKDSSNQMGKVAYQVGELYRLAQVNNARLSGCSALLRLLVFNSEYPDEIVMKSLNREGLNRVREMIAQTREMIKSSKMNIQEGQLIAEEFNIVVELLDFASAFGLILLDHPEIKNVSKLPKDVRIKLQTQLDLLLNKYKEVWLLRDQKGGLDDSVRRIEHLKKLLA